ADFSGPLLPSGRRRAPEGHLADTQGPDHVHHRRDGVRVDYGWHYLRSRRRFRLGRPADLRRLILTQYGARLAASPFDTTKEEESPCPNLQCRPTSPARSGTPTGKRPSRPLRRPSKASPTTPPRRPSSRRTVTSSLTSTRSRSSRSRSAACPASGT